MAKFFVRQECWQHWPKTVIVGENRDGGVEYRRYVPDRGKCHPVDWEEDGYHYMLCSNCRTLQDDPPLDELNFCPYCGAEVTDS